MTLTDIIQKLQQESLGPEALQALLVQALQEIEPMQNVATRVEFYQLSKAIEALTVAQEKTEKHLEELVEGEKRTEERLEKLAARVEELSEAQRRTEESLLTLTHRVKVVEDRLEGISHSVGYSLENAAFKALTALFY